MSQKAGIIGYGAYVPRYRIKAVEIARAWGNDPEAYRKGLGIEEKAVAGPDQDTITLAVEAARSALRRSGTDPALIGALYIGSESHPYAVKPSGTVVAEAIGATPRAHLADLQFACNAGAEAMFICVGLVESRRVKHAMAIGADTSQGAPGDPLEFATSAAGAAFLFGSDNPLATVDFMTGYATDTPDFWRRDGRKYPCHGGRFTGEPAYFHHIVSAGKALLEDSGMQPKQFAHAVFHQPNGKFPVRAGKMLGFTQEQLSAGLLSPRIGNCYSASSPVGLCAILDKARPGDRIFMVSYGSGAGSNGFIFTATERIERARGLAPTVEGCLSRPTVSLDYAAYAKFRRKIARGGVE